MPFIVAAAFLVFIGLSGGLSGGLAGSTSADTTSAQTFTVVEKTPTASASSEASNTASVNTSTKASSKYGTSFWNFGKKTDVTTNSNIVPVVFTDAALDIEDKSASLRGSVDMYAQKTGVVFAVYGYNLNEVKAVGANYKTFENLPDFTNDKVRTYVLDRRASGQEAYSRKISNLVADTNYYYKLCVEYDTTTSARAIKCGGVKMFTTNDRYSTNSTFRTPSARTARAESITAGAAILNGSVNMNDGRDGTTFFAYGQSKEAITAIATSRSYTAVSEQGDNLQKARVGSFVRGQASYVKQIEDLDNGEMYFYRFCVEYTGEKDGVVCGSVNSFTTDQRNRNTLPYAETTTVQVGTGKVTFKSLIQMNDFSDGVGFIIVGKDSNKVSAITSQNSFANIRQSGYELQKILIDADIDSNRTYTKTVEFLEKGTYSYRTCVQYQAEDDNNRERDYLRCGDIKTLTIY